MCRAEPWVQPGGVTVQLHVALLGRLLTTQAAVERGGKRMASTAALRKQDDEPCQAQELLYHCIQLHAMVKNVCSSFGMLCGDRLVPSGVCGCCVRVPLVTTHSLHDMMSSCCMGGPTRGAGASG